jgi:hypothetical protein
MSWEKWAIFMLAWTAAGLVAAIAIGHMFPADNADQDVVQPESSAHNIHHFRRKQRLVTQVQATR